MIGHLEHGTAQAPVAIGQQVIRAIVLSAGFPEDSAGHFTTDSSDANYTALICALTRADTRFADEGLRAFAGPVAMYVSRECEPPWQEVAHRSGLGRGALKLIATDGAGRMDVRALADAVREDRRRGTVPVLIAATAGTIGAGMIDPLEPCATVARESNIWYHIDAPCGGVALSCELLRGELAGIELADSVTIDTHAWPWGSAGCGIFITREPAILSEAFGSVVQATAQWQGHGPPVERALQAMDDAKARLLAKGWAVANESPLPILCVLPPAGSPSVREIVGKMLASGSTWVTVAKLEGRDVVRICATRGESLLVDVDELVAGLEAAR